MSNYIDIQTFIKSTYSNKNENTNKNESKKQVIPKTIIQTYYTNKIHPTIYQNIMEILEKNPEYDYRLITDKEGIELMKTHYSERVLNAFQQLKLGAAKGDFIRYIALYVYGGVYLDLDASIDTDLKNITDTHNEFVFFVNGEKNLEQFCFLIRPQHPILINIIEEMVKRIENKEKNIFIATGPTLFNDVVLKMMTNKPIYNSSETIDHMDRGDCFEKNNRFMGGKLLFRFNNDVEEQIIFRIPDSEDMLYENNEAIRYSMFDPSTNIVSINAMF